MRVKKTDIAGDFGDLGPAFVMLAQNEEDLCDVFTKVGQCADQLNHAYGEQAAKLEGSLKHPLREYILMSQSAKVRPSTVDMNCFFEAPRVLTPPYPPLGIAQESRHCAL
jgi:hypothetical protein